MYLNYKKYGDAGEHLIILHGLFGMLDNWHSLATHFGNYFQVWAIDQRNHGKSPHSDDFNYDLLVQDLFDFCEQHEIKTANIIGHSMGGKVAMQFALEHPEKVTRLIVADVAPKNYSGKGHEILMEALMSLNLNRITRRSQAEEALMQEIPQESTRQFLLKNLTREGDSYSLKMNLPSLSKNYENITGPIDAKGVFEKQTLFIQGGESDYIQEEDKPYIMEHFPNAVFITIPGAGHWVHAEAPAKFFDVVMDFAGIEQRVPVNNTRR
jgi:esterase